MSLIYQNILNSSKMKNKFNKATLNLKKIAFFSQNIKKIIKKNKKFLFKNNSKKIKCQNLNKKKIGNIR